MTHKSTTEAAEAMLDKIEKWLKESPTQPHIEYRTATNLDGELVDVRPFAMEVWDTEAMLAEWESIREEAIRSLEVNDE